MNSSQSRLFIYSTESRHGKLKTKCPQLPVEYGQGFKHEIFAFPELKTTMPLIDLERGMH